MEKIPYQLIPLFESAGTLADLMDTFESLENITDAEIARALEAKLIHFQAVDTVIELFDQLKYELTRLKDLETFYRTRRKNLEAFEARLKDGCKQIVESHVDEDGKSIPFKGRLGKISSQRNKDVVKFEFDIDRMSDKIVQLFGIPDQYLRKKVYYELDKTKIKADLQAGNFEGTWAWLDRSSHLRIRR